MRFSTRLHPLGECLVQLRAGLRFFFCKTLTEGDIFHLGKVEHLAYCYDAYFEWLVDDM